MFYVALRYNTVEVIKIAVDKLFNKERVAWTGIYGMVEWASRGSKGLVYSDCNTTFHFTRGSKSCVPRDWSVGPFYIIPCDTIFNTTMQEAVSIDTVSVVLVVKQ